MSQIQYDALLMTLKLYDSYIGITLSHKLWIIKNESLL